MVIKIFQSNLNLVWNMRLAKSIFFFPNQTGTGLENCMQYLGVTFKNQSGFGLEKDTEWNVAAVQSETLGLSKKWTSSMKYIQIALPCHPTDGDKECCCSIVAAQKWPRPLCADGEGGGGGSLPGPAPGFALRQGHLLPQVTLAWLGLFVWQDSYDSLPREIDKVIFVFSLTD